MTGRRRFWLINGTLAVVVAALALLGADTIFHKNSAHAAPRTVTAELGAVQSTVSASGNVSPAETENVNFATSGTVTAVDVALGQHVNAGQVLGTIDPGPAQAALAAAQDNLTAAQDTLTLAQGGGETPPQVAQDTATIAAADQQISAAQTTLTTAQQKLASDQAACAADPPSTGGTGSTGSSGSTGSTGGSGSRPSTPGSSSTTGTSGSTGSNGGGTGSNTGSTGSTAGTGSTGSTGNTGNSASSTATGCAAETGDQQAITQDQDALTQAQEALNQDQLSIQAKRYVNPATILQDQASVTQAQATVTADQKTLSETTLTAPFAGSVTALNGAVGQTVSGGGNSAGTSTSSGSGASSATGSAATGGTGAGGAGSSGSGSSGSGSSGSSSSSPFLTLSNVSSLQVVAGFAEADSVKITAGQPATITLSALTGTSVAGKVAAVSPVSTVVSNVVTYDVTVDLTNPPTDVKSGMTANVSVIVASANNVLELPTSAITTTGRFSTVTVLKNGKQSIQTVTTGLAGDTDTQISSGLSAGEVVVEPSVTVSGTGTGATGTGIGAGGLGGGGGFFGGGGGGALGGGGFTRGGG